jgi:cytochrome b6-f complex iron-sulfur subunit
MMSLAAISRFVLRHEQLVVLFWVVVTIAGIVTTGPASDAWLQRFDLPGRDSTEVNAAILARYGNGGCAAPYAAVISLPQGTTVDSPGVSADLAEVFDRVAAAAFETQVVSYASTGDRAFVSADGRTTFAPIYPRYAGDSASPDEMEVKAAFSGITVAGMVKSRYCSEGTQVCGATCAGCPTGARASRRGVIKRAILGVTGFGLVGVATACSVAREADSESSVSEVVVASVDVPPANGAPYRSSDGKFYLVHNADGVLAFSWRCTHQGCEVPWKEDEQRFHCPCHGSIYDRNGVRLDGPAPRPLDLVAVEVQDNGDVVVHPKEKTKRSDYDAEQAVPYPDTGQARMA